MADEEKKLNWTSPSVSFIYIMAGVFDCCRRKKDKKKRKSSVGYMRLDIHITFVDPYSPSHAQRNSPLSASLN